MWYHLGMPSFPRSTSKAGKADRGPTPVATTPLTIRARPRLDAALDASVRDRTSRAMGRWARMIERITIRFADENGPRGGVDCRCALDIVVTGLPPVHVDRLAADPGAAFGPALRAAVQAVRRLLEHRQRSAGRAKGAAAARTKLAPAPSLIGRREGRSKLAKQMVLARPEKQVRDLFTDTALPGVSQTDRRAGGGHSARRNTRKGTAGMTVALEDSLGTPSRKSSRRSANRGKPSQGKERAAQMKAVTPKARRSRG